MLTEDQYNSRSIWIVSEDGFWDICIGLLLFGIGITITIDQFIWFIGIFLLVYFMVLMAGKEAVTRPRLINFEFQKNQLRNFTLKAVIDILILFAASISQILNIPIVPIIYIIGAIFTVIGITLLIRFIYRYPTSGTQNDIKI
jgi:hypothetical protein